MSNTFTLTPEAVHSLELSGKIARYRHQHLIDCEHLLAGALQSELGKQVVLASNVSAESLETAVLNELGVERDEPLTSTRGLTKQANVMMGQAALEAKNLGQHAINSAHLVVAAMATAGPLLKGIIETDFPTLDLEIMRNHVRQFSPDIKGVPSNIGIENPVPNASTRPRQMILRPSNQRERRNQRQQTASGRDLSGLWFFLAAILIGGYLYVLNPTIGIPIIIVIGGWIVSLTLHEFAHALVAYWGGDHTVVEKGYLSLNPLRYTHPLLSIGLPLLFLAIGGIGLPGGAVYIERHRLKSKYWGSAVSIAGPFANLICFIVFSAPFWSGYVSIGSFKNEQDLILWSSVAFLSWLQITAIFLNLLPIPPLDGFGVIEPFLAPDLARQMRSFGSLGFMLIFLMFWFPAQDSSSFSPARSFFNQVDAVTEQFDIPAILSDTGYYYFRFWDKE